MSKLLDSLQKRETGKTPAFLRDVMLNQRQREIERNRHANEIYKEFLQKNIQIQKNARSIATQPLTTSQREYLYDRIDELETQKQDIKSRFDDVRIEGRDDPVRVAQDLGLVNRDDTSFQQNTEFVFR